MVFLQIITFSFGTMEKGFSPASGTYAGCPILTDVFSPLGWETTNAKVLGAASGTLEAVGRIWIRSEHCRNRKTGSLNHLKSPMHIHIYRSFSSLQGKLREKMFTPPPVLYGCETVRDPGQARSIRTKPSMQTAVAAKSSRSLSLRRPSARAPRLSRVLTGSVRC